ncbi:hypothetical protein [Actinopolymorpha rutila]|uniref:Excreted virulence factor EspC, type VII ESX diderm n=1 Tax=Actinopolymorpha rutila TaxID=446787 RepID=A0A852ZP22_9ACTN|nr:hypothetical protein [Actinopolymorpha rutila]NYH93648.1 hypothetical protein [Actinopolymorpha rutila]
MSKEFDPATIRSAAKDLLKAADHLDDEIDSFLNETKSIGEACGDAEPIGMLLGISCAAAEEVIVEGLASVVTGFEIFAGKLEAMAGSDERTEHGNKTTFDSVEI